MNPYRIRKLLGPLLIAAILLTAIAWSRKGTFVDSGSVQPELRQEPIQDATSQQEFSFEYKGKSCSVRPVATYELTGLVVSHNNIKSVADIYHDSTSVDTKDLCVIWGSNFETNDFHSVDFKSGPWTCYFSYPHGVKFDHAALGNNHLITDSPAIRRQIDKVRIGDQIRMSGLLVDYQMSDWESFWRKTSTIREDSDCEVIFVEQLEVLERGTPGWYRLYRLGWLAIIAIPILFLITIWMEAGTPEQSQLGRL